MPLATPSLALGLILPPYVTALKDCVTRDSDAIFGGMFGAPTKECVPATLECDAFNNGNGCAATESCLPKNSNDRAHRGCLKRSAHEGGGDASDCFQCIVPSASSETPPGRPSGGGKPSGGGPPGGMPPWMTGVWDGMRGWMGQNGDDTTNPSVTRAPICAGCTGQPGSPQASSDGDGGGASTTAIAVGVSVGVVVVAVVIVVAVVMSKNKGGGGGDGANAESFTNPGYGDLHAADSSGLDGEGGAADSGAGNTAGYMDIPAPRDGLENPQYMEIAPQGEHDFSASSA